MEEVLSKNGVIRTPSKHGDVGYNLPSKQRYVIQPGGFVTVWSGECIAQPYSMWCMVLPRSSTNISGKLVVLPGVIDPGYRGELGVMVHNVYRASAWENLRWWCRRMLGRNDPPPGTVVVEAGQSIGQLVFLASVVPSLQVVEELPPSIRGVDGFGSSGK